MSHCRRCPARIVWARTAVGKAMPLDANDNGTLRRFEPDDGHANVAVAVDGGAPVARLLADGELPSAGEVRAMPHFATCPGWST